MTEVLLLLQCSQVTVWQQGMALTGTWEIRLLAKHTSSPVLHG